MERNRSKLLVKFEDQIVKDYDNTEELEDDVFSSEDKVLQPDKIIYPEDISSDFDTDLEIEPPPKEQPSNAESCIRTYKTACSHLGNYPPQQKIMDTMDKPMMSLSGRSLGPEAIRPLCIALNENVKVETLNLDSADLRDEGSKYVSEMLLENVSVSRLNISNNGLGPIAAKYLSVAIVQTRFLQQLNLSENKFEFESAVSLARCIAKSGTLTSLNLSKNKFCSKSGEVLGLAIAENRKLEKLNLSWNEIRGKGAVAVFKGIKVNTHLRFLDLSWNGLGYEGVLAFCQALQYNNTLQTIDLSNNRINWKAAEILSKALKKNSSLQQLKIGGNPLTTTGAMDLVEATETKTSAIRLLDMSGVPVQSETALLAIVINRQRSFNFLHGGIVHTPDVLGQRFVLQATAMQRLIAYMKRLGIRPVELLRGFDKSVSFDITKEEFVSRVKKCGVNLFKFELDALADAMASNGTINYKKLIDAVKEEYIGERRLKIKVRQQKIKVKEHHKRILDLDLPKEVVSTDDEDLIVTTNSQGRTRIKKLPSLGRTSSAASMISNATCLTNQSILSTVKTKSSGISYSAPLGGEPKVVKKKRRKKRVLKKAPTVKSWMDGVQV